MFKEPLIDPSPVDIYCLGLFALLQAEYYILLVKFKGLDQESPLWETAHDLDIDRMPDYIVPMEQHFPHNHDSS